MLMKSGRILFIIIFIAAITGNCDGGKVEKPDNKAPFFETTLDIDERLKTADSLIVVFYKDPYGTDSLRYTRYYTQISIVGSNELDLLQQQLAQKTSRQEKFRNCRGEGKIWCYSYEKIFQTLYFSNRCDDCCHVYIIKDGFYYYTPIAESMIAWLDSIKPLSKEPLNAAADNEKE